VRKNEEVQHLYVTDEETRLVYNRKSKKRPESDENNAVFYFKPSKRKPFRYFPGTMLTMLRFILSLRPTVHTIHPKEY